MWSGMADELQPNGGNLGIASWIMEQVRCVFIIFSILWDIFMQKIMSQKKITLGLIYGLHVVNTGLSIFHFCHCFSVKKEQKEKEDSSLRMYVKLVFCLASQFKRKNISFNHEF